MKGTFFGTGGAWGGLKEWWLLQKAEKSEENEDEMENRSTCRGKWVLVILFLVADKWTAEAIHSGGEGELGTGEW